MGESKILENSFNVSLGLMFNYYYYFLLFILAVGLIYSFFYMGEGIKETFLNFLKGAFAAFIMEFILFLGFTAFLFISKSMSVVNHLMNEYHLKYNMYFYSSVIIIFILIIVLGKMLRDRM
jgi:hypothetical protein